MKRSITWRVFLAALLVSSLPLLSAMVVLQTREYESATRLAKSLQREVSERVSARIEAFFATVDDVLTVPIRFFDFEALPMGGRRLLLSQLLSARTFFRDLALLDGDGQVQVFLSRAEVKPPPDLVAPPATAAITARQDAYIGPVRFDPSSGEPALQIVQSLRSRKTDDLYGFLAATVDLRSVWELFRNIRLDTGDDAYLLDAEGRVVAHRNPTLVLQGSRFDVRSGTTVQRGLQGRRVVLASRPLRVGQQTFTVVAERDLASALSLFVGDLVTGGLVLGLALLLAMLLAAVAARWIVRPIRAVSLAARSIHDGDLSTRAPVASQDEIGELAQSFNDMADRLQGMISELHAAQEELLRKERLAVLGQLTGTVSHELRNPLGALRNAVAAIKQLAGGEDPRLAGSVAIADRCVTRLDNVVADLLDYSRSQPLQSESTDLDSWLTAVLDEYEPPPGITLRRVTASGATLEIDRDRLRRVVINLLDNACQAMAGENKGAAGTGECVLAAKIAPSGEAVEISVSDSGPGIPRGDEKRIFEPYYSTKRAGVGLGLAIVKRIVDQHRGTIRIESEEGGGARAVVRLPLASPQRSAES